MTRTGRGGKGASAALSCLWLAACSSTTAPPRDEARSPDAACESAGEPEACAAAAELYFDGKNHHPLDHARSFRLASAACEKGHAFACALVGYHQQDGLGVPWAPEQAVASYEKACAGGAGVGCYNLASMYYGGHGVMADESRADAYKARAKAAWRAACEGSQPRWCTNLAYLLREEDMKGNREKALALDQRSCDDRVLVGCTEAVRDRFALGRIGATAMAGELERLCREGEPTACTEVASAFLDGETPGIAKDAARGIKLLVRGCEIGDKVACARAGAEHAAGQLVPRSQSAADRYLTQACDRAMGVACQWLAKEHVARGAFPEAAVFARRACQMGERESCAALAAFYQEGRGVAKDAAAGRRWTFEACRMGYRPACGWLIEQGAEPLPVPADLGEEIRREACAGGIQRACGPPGAAQGP